MYALRSTDMRWRMYLDLWNVYDGFHDTKATRRGDKTSQRKNLKTFALCLANFLGYSPDGHVY